MNLRAIKQQLIANAENLAGKDKGAVDGELDSEKEILLFGQELNKAVEAGTLDDYQADMLAKEFGLQLSGVGSTKNTDEANAPAGARGGIGNDTTDINISIVINIDIDIVVKACGGSEVDLQRLVDMLIAEMTKEGGSVEAFILGLIKAFAGTTEVDLSSITELLNQIKSKLDEQGQKIDDLQESINDLKEFIKTELTNLYDFLSSKFSKLGIDISALATLVNTNDEKILTKLGEIHAAIMELTGKFQSFTEIEQQRFDDIMIAIGSFGGDPTEILEKLNTMYTLLLAIQTDTTETKNNSAALISLVKQNHVEVMQAIANINTVQDPEIKQMLTTILTNMATKEDVKAEMEKLDALTTLIKQNHTEVMEAISKINLVQDPEIKQMLTTILTNMATKADLDVQLTKFNELLANYQRAIEIKINSSEINIINAMSNVENNIKVAIANITINPDHPDTSGIMQLLNNIMTKLNQMDASNVANFSAVFQAIANIKPGEIDLTAVLNLLNEIKGIAEANGQQIQNVLNNQATIQLTLNGLVEGLGRLEGKVDGVKEVADDIQEMVSKLHNCDCEHLDEERLRAILCEFIQKIQGDANEGIQDDVPGVLGARGFRAPAQEKTYPQLVNELRAALGLGGASAVVSPKAGDDKNAPVYDLGGRVVNGPLKHGEIYIKNGKKFIAQ